MYQRFSILLEKGQITAPTKPWGGGGGVSTHSFMKPIYNCRFFEVFGVSGYNKHSCMFQVKGFRV